MKKQYKKILKLIRNTVPIEMIIYDLGQKTDLSRLMEDRYSVFNNIGFADLDFVQSEITAISTKTAGIKRPGITTSFGILEQLLNPFAVLQAIRTPELLCAVPLQYSAKDKSVFKKQQFLQLLEKTGWEVIDSGKWYFGQGFGIRPFLRLLWPSYLWVHAKQKELTGRTKL